MRVAKAILLFVGVVFAAAVSGVYAETWGTIKGKFIYDGEAPAPKMLKCSPDGVINKEPEVCCKVQHFDESLKVAKDGGVANVIIYLRTKNAKVNPERLKEFKEPVLLDNKNCKFEPHVVGLVKGQTLSIGNSDNVGHNSNVSGQGVNPIVPAGQKVDTVAKTLTLIPNEVTCNIHPWMKGYVLVRPDPYFAISAEDGTFEIKDLPAGDHEFQVWHERAGFVTAVKVKDKATKWTKGRFKEKVKEGETDLGEIKIDPKVFK